MLKKSLIASVVCLGLFAVVAGGKPFRYAKTWVKNVGQSVEDAVPMDFKIQNAKEELAGLAKPINACKQIVFEQRAKVSRQSRTIAKRRTILESKKTLLVARRNDLKEKNATYVYHGNTFTESEVKRDLSLQFRQYKASVENLSADSRILDAQKKSLEANQRKLTEMLSAQKELEVTIAELEARWKTVQASQAASEMQLDDTRLSEVKSLIRDLSDKLDYEESVLEAQGESISNALIPLEAPRNGINKDIEKEMDAFFGGDSKGEIVKSDK